ncbi:hypothetical protein [Archangium violaceum]
MTATPEPGLESATVYVVDYMEPGAVTTQQVPMHGSRCQLQCRSAAR